ncbi:MAG: hypothetical protein JSV63_04110 [Candidatus Aenigmatarchaeota archaeon]|nr:MAG: hypothetical protein JSV63_04110 [Candidatus Aenigmarchaeota archaeon]
MMPAKSRKAGKYEKNLDRLISLVTQKGLDPFSEERKKSMLYQLEAEEIDLKKLEEND